MEHRYFPRRLENFDVILQRKTGETIDTRVLDVSREGLRVSVNSASISPGSIVDIIMPSNRESLFGTCSLRAFVAHAEPGVLGLWLIDVAKKIDQMFADK
ncbi:MAG TPA: hypothetical protein ENI98_07295 [Gammaproteobacteria bacterium]|nr:hypothetical protein [Gammaproteobacteria bacterium]